jgi:hypothetical protein
MLRNTLAALAVALTASTWAAPSFAATPPETPAHFVARVFALYRTGSAWWSDGRAGDAYRKRTSAQFFDPSFEALQDENGRLAGKAGNADLDYDPVCQCQDSGGAYHYVSGAVATGGLFNAAVADADTHWTLVLKPVAGSWRVYDVVDSQGSIRAMLTRHNACMRKYTTDADLVKCFGDPS